ncbi:MAG: hypothetical protein OSA81_08595 [Longimicrobiales bacterium]|nr:hypothetical protein [Longimicrobiales bacterium]
MKTRIFTALLLCFSLAACGGGPPGPPTLAYGSQATNKLTYQHGDTTAVSVSIMGQSMEVNQSGVATYAVGFSSVPDGVGVTMSLQDLEASITQPVGAPIQLDESGVQGDLTFVMGRTGNTVSIGERPAVTDEASQMVSGLSLAYMFFPGLPGIGAMMGDSWVDTVSFEGEDGPGMRSETSVLTYVVEGDTVVAGRALLRISFSGTSSSEQDLEMGGMDIHQESEAEVLGYVLWDHNESIMFEHHRVATGSGTLSLPIMPTAIPMDVVSTQHTRLEGM